jgi:hypothetical protein
MSLRKLIYRHYVIDVEFLLTGTRLIPREEASRRESMAKLGEVTVRSCEDLHEEWTVPVEGKTFSTGSIRSKVVVQEDNGALEILQRDGYIQSGPPVELVNQLAKLFNIPTNYHLLLSCVLMPGLSDQHLNETLAAEGVPDDLDAWDYIFDESFTGNEMRRAKKSSMTAMFLLSKTGPFVPYGDNPDGVHALARCRLVVAGLENENERGDGVMGDFVLGKGARLAGIAFIMLGGLNQSKPSRKERFLGERKVSYTCQRNPDKASVARAVRSPDLLQLHRYHGC